MKIDNGELVFETSGRIWAGTNGRIVGINPDLDVYGGYDGSLYVPSEKWSDDPEDNEWVLSKAEQVEVADYMIGLWTRFKERAQEKTPPG